MMSSIDYSFFEQREFGANDVGDLQFDVFLSAYNASARVRDVFQGVNASSKIWLIHPEYEFESQDLPSADARFVSDERDEAEFWASFFAAFELPVGARVAVDITGMMRPHLMLLPKLLSLRGHGDVTFLYSDPVSYASGPKTRFAQGAVTEVRQVRGFEGLHLPGPGEADLLVIGAGYDDELIRRVAEDKQAARKLQMFGLPSLQAHMYQEGQYRAAAAAESVSPMPEQAIVFAPANNPFETAHVLQNTLSRARTQTPVANIYLCPLATKPQALGFALYHLHEEIGRPTSIIYPIAPFYTKETSVGLSRVSTYRLELGSLP